MKEDIETSTVYKGTSSKIHNDLIEPISIAINETVRDEINQADFVSIQADKTTDASVTEQLSIIVRYVRALKTEGRFLGFF